MKGAVPFVFRLGINCAPHDRIATLLRLWLRLRCRFQLSDLFFHQVGVGAWGRYLIATRRCSRAPGKSCLLARITASSCSALGSV